MFPIFCFLSLLILPIQLVFAQEVEGLILQNTTPSLVTDSRIELSQYIDNMPPRISLAPGVSLISCVFQNKACRLPLVVKFKGTAPESADHYKIQLEILTQGKKKSFEILPVPKSFPFFSVEGKSVLQEPIIFSTNVGLDSCYLIKLTPEGHLDFFRRMPFLGSEFRPHLIKGKQFYSFQAYTDFIDRMGFMGPRYILDENFNEVKTILLPLECHEFLLKDLNHWVSFEVEFDRLKNGLPYVNKKIRERVNNKIVFEWGVSDFIKQFNTEVFADAFVTSYKNEIIVELLHMNSIQRLNDGSFLVGTGQNGIIAVDKKSAKVKWVLGGMYDQFSLPIHQRPIFEHTAWLDEKTQNLYLFVNSAHAAQVDYDSKVFRYKLDTKRKKILEFEVVRRNLGFTDTSGSVQVTGKTFSIGLGRRLVGKSDFIEWHNNQETMRLAFKERHEVYRYYRHPYSN